MVRQGFQHAAGGVVGADLRNRDDVARLLDSTQPDVVIHAAAYRDPDFCETHPEEARRLNVEATRAFCDLLSPAARLIFISSDYVFDGETPPYREDDLRRPVSCYGQTKVEAEDAVQARVGASAILRVPLLVGGGPTPEVSGFLYQLMRDLCDGQPREADDVLIRFPTWTEDVAEVLAYLLAQNVAGVVHFSGPEGLTRYGCFQVAARVSGLSADAIRPSRAVVPRLARRPPNSQLATVRLRAMGYTRFTPLADVLTSWLQNEGKRLYTADAV